MSADLVNLRQARKARAKAEREAAAAQNRILFGRTKAEKEREAAEAARKAREIDGHRRDRSLADRDD